MRARDEVAYRLALAEGFLAEAEQDMELERWRSCVNNAQLVVENAGKAVLAWFGAVSKTMIRPNRSPPYCVHRRCPRRSRRPYDGNFSITWGLEDEKPGFSEKPGFFPRTIEMIHTTYAA